MGTMILLDLMGAVALLLWGLHMVRTGIIRAFGSSLRRVLGTALHNRFTAFLAGMAATAVLQSSTATALMTTSFAAGGLVALVPALSIMLGANVGTTLIVQVLSFNVSAVAPLFFLAGLGFWAWAYRRRRRALTGCEEKVCRTPASRRLSGVLFWASLIALLIAAGYPYAVAHIAD